jgi:amidohydrolase
MHACGHDAHAAILMGAASALAARREQLPGSVLFVFQPAEEGAPDGEEGGAALMLKEGLFHRYRPDAVIGLHVFSTLRVGELGVRGGPTMAESDRFRIVLRGVQTHGAKPWAGIDPIVTGAQLVMNLQTVVSRRVNTVESPAVLTVGAFRGGNRHNIVPESVELLGTVRSFHDETREAIFADIRRIAEHTAAAAGARAEVEISRQTNVNRNDEALTRRLRPALEAVVGVERTREMPLQTVAEDFGYFAAEVPGFYYFVGSTPADQDPRTAPTNHSPMYYVDEGALEVGLRSMLRASVLFLSAPPP